MNKLIIIFLTLLVVYEGVNSKKYLQCEFTRELFKNKNVPKYLIPSYVCLAKTVSGLDANLFVNKTLLDARLGIFQIQAKDYCKFGKVAGGKCNMKCQDLLDDSITDDIECARKIQTTVGFKHWEKWLVACTDRDRLPNLFNCGH